jgi:hypothetical protein
MQDGEAVRKLYALGGHTISHVNESLDMFSSMTYSTTDWPGHVTRKSIAAELSSKGESIALPRILTLYLSLTLEAKIISSSVSKWLVGAYVTV